MSGYPGFGYFNDDGLNNSYFDGHRRIHDFHGKRRFYVSMSSQALKPPSSQALKLLVLAGKIFVGGLHSSTSVNSLSDYFSRFGRIAECLVMRDPKTNMPRGFGFVTFDDPAAVDAVLRHHFHILDGKRVSSHCIVCYFHLHLDRS